MNRPHHALRVPVGPTDHVLGADHAPVTLVEYGDFECPICRQAAPAVRMLLDRFDGRVRVAFRHFPLEEAHPHALQAALAAEAAAAQDRFWQMHDLLFANQTRLSTRALQGYAESLGLDMARYVAEMDDQIYLQRVREHIDGARRSGLRATPGFFLDGVIADVSFGMQELEHAIEAAIDRHRPRR